MSSPSGNPSIEASEDDPIGCAEKNISDVVSDIQRNLGAEADNILPMEDIPIDSLELSETQSQSIDGTEPVTQLEDVPAQLEAERARNLEKIERAKNRRSKFKEDNIPDVSVPAVANIPTSPVKHVKERVGVAMLKKSKKLPTEPTRRSPRVAASSTVPVDQALKVNDALPNKKQPPPMFKGSAAKGNKEPAKGKKQTVANVKKQDVVSNDDDFSSTHEADDKDDSQTADDSEDEADINNYEFVERATKRKRGVAAASRVRTGEKLCFNTTARCSLKETMQDARCKLYEENWHSYMSVVLVGAVIYLMLKMSIMMELVAPKSLLPWMLLLWTFLLQWMPSTLIVSVPHHMICRMMVFLNMLVLMLVLVVRYLLLKMSIMMEQVPPNFLLPRIQLLPMFLLQMFSSTMIMSIHHTRISRMMVLLNMLLLLMPRGLDVKHLLKMLLSILLLVKILLLKMLRKP